MQTNVSKWGNSLGIRIPRSVAEQIGITEGASIELTVEDNHIIIQKIYRLESLLAEVIKENLHSEVSTGSIRGSEAW